MSAEKITCNVCHQAMPERITRPISVQLPPKKLADGLVQKRVVQFLAGGHEVALVPVPNYDTEGRKIGITNVEQMRIDPKDFDTCINCLIDEAHTALIILEREILLKNSERSAF